MPDCTAAFDYAVIRVVPRVEREEFLNAGVIVHCPERRFLEARVAIEEARLRALWPEFDIAALRPHLEALPRVAAGDPSAGPIAQLSQRERFHWLVAPRSTVVQVSPVHSGLCDDPGAVVARLFDQLVGTGSR